VFAAPPVKGGTVAVDQTAVGRAVFELVLDAKTGASVYGVTVTAGRATSVDEPGGWLVPKMDLAGVLQWKRIKVAPTLEFAQTVVGVLPQFQLKTVPVIADPAVEWRERAHDAGRLRRISAVSTIYPAQPCPGVRPAETAVDVTSM
jgi:hypothetical protein